MELGVGEPRACFALRKVGAVRRSSSSQDMLPLLEGPELCPQFWFMLLGSVLGTWAVSPLGAIK